ncbi:stalk domain-containing protein [Paenibacillus sp. BR2-3]|uniref:stalk domain-containing protein n=1 Tax=Paenibacillus sp. BR2-3 TaxID=3048494 RepID=UPI0039773F99
MRRVTIIRGLYAMLALLLLMTFLPAQMVHAAEKSRLDLILKVGSTTASVNGKKITIVKPFVEKGAVMVPLGVFKKTFGSTVSLEQDDIVRVMYGTHTGTMRIGSATAWKDGVKVKLVSPPRMVAGVLMVPLRFVAGVIGAGISSGNNGDILVSLTAPQDEKGSPEDRGGIDSDVGKTKIGNSYYQWSMNYPSGLMVGDNGGEESVATFMSAENLYYLEIHATIQEVQPDADEMLDQLVRSAEDGGETVLDREIFPQAKVPYARVVSKDSSGALWEGRQYYGDGRLYELYLTDDNAVNYKDFAKYAGLLNSFQPSFNDKDQTIRDLSTVKNGFRAAYNDDYGISLQVPADWSKDDQHLYYESKKGSYLRLKVSSAPAGSSLASWGEELKTRAEDSFVPDAYSVKGSSFKTISGVQAQINEVQYNYGNGWTTEYQLLLLKNGYRFYGQFVAPPGQEEEKVNFNAMLSSLDIDFETIKENFGRLAEDSYVSLKHKAVTKISKTFGYVIDIPLLWMPYQDIFELRNIEYRFTGGRLQINLSPEDSMEYTVNQLKRYYGNKNNDPKGPVIESVEETTFADQPATVITVHQTKGGIPYRIKAIVLSKEDKVYTLTVTLNDANATAEQQRMVEQTLKSFRFTGNGS